METCQRPIQVDRVHDHDVEDDNVRRVNSPKPLSSGECGEPPKGPPAPPGLADPSLPDPGGGSRWEGLIILGKDQGYVTYGDVVSVLRALNQAVRPPNLGPAFEALRSMGIEVRRDGA
jgi:hypothetical protein